MTIHDLPTPAILIDAGRLAHNIAAMQSACDATGVQLWPHVKTHKLAPVLKCQLEAGATGATFAKVSEAEALLSSGVRRIFIAHSLVQPLLAPRLRKLYDQVDSMLLSITSVQQLAALESLLDDAGIKVDALIAVDTGLAREGCRTIESAMELAKRVRDSSRIRLAGIYTHEGHAYLAKPEEVASVAESVHRKMIRYADAMDLSDLWPGCSVTATRMAGFSQVAAVRPGSYVFGDLSLIDSTGVMPVDQAAVTILTTVVDTPEKGLSLIDAGSKVFSSDKTAEGVSGRSPEEQGLTVYRLSEEHGYVKYLEHLAPRIGDRIQFIPAHVCPVLNLASTVYLIDGEQIVETWSVDARGCST